MTTIQLLIVCVTVLLLATVVLLPVFLRVFVDLFGPADITAIPSAVRIDDGPRIGSRIALHKLDGQAVEGMLEERTLDGDFVLSQVRIYSGPGAQVTDAEGRWTVLASRVEAVQEI